MIDKVRNIAEGLLGEGLFLVDVELRGGEVEVTIDGDGGVSIEDCVGLSKALEEAVGEEYSLVVGSAGLGVPFKILRQYRNAIGKTVEVVLRSGKKLVGQLVSADEASIGVRFEEKQKLEGKKRPQIVEVERTFDLAEVKAVKEHIDFK